MSHFAKIQNSLVISVIAAEQAFVDTLDGTWVQTSYNTRGGIHYGADGMADGNTPLRANFAGIGYHYDAVADVFYAPQPLPHSLYELDTTAYLWKLKPEFSPLVLAQAKSTSLTIPSAAADTPINIDGTVIRDRAFVFFPLATTNPGIYKYYQELGLLSYKAHLTATIKVAEDDTQVWKFKGNAWVSQAI